jgi:hypothetical protein
MVTCTEIEDRGNQPYAMTHHLLWTIPGCPYRITIPATALREINQIAVESGVETGGVFFGLAAGESLHILAYRPVSVRYLTGASFELSVDDKTQLSSVLALPESDPKLAKLSALGWYHSRYGSENLLSQEDLELYNELFPRAQQFALVLCPDYMKPTRARFFFRDAEGRIQADAPLQEFIVEPPGSELTLLDGEAQSALDHLLDAHGVCLDAVDEDALPAAAKPPEPHAPVAPLVPVVSGMDAEAPTSTAVPVPEEPKEKRTRGGWWRRALHDLIPGSDRRSANRTAGTGLTAFFWDGGLPKANAVRDISRHGVFVESEVLWVRGTRIVLTLQIGAKSLAENGLTDAIAIPAEVVGSAPGGMELRFLFIREEAKELLRFLLRWKPDFVR